jgi:hypothetical protein
MVSFMCEVMHNKWLLRSVESKGKVIINMSNEAILGQWFRTRTVDSHLI